MAKLGCTCGHVISDNTDNLPYKAYFLPDEEVYSTLDIFGGEVAEFLEARERGKQIQWLQEHGGLPRDLTLKRILSRSFLHPIFGAGRMMYECERCGRVWLEASPNENHYLSYVPESARKGVLTHAGAAGPTATEGSA
jgi:hypothetical protein